MNHSAGTPGPRRVTRIMFQSGLYSQLCAVALRFVKTATPTPFVAANPDRPSPFFRRRFIVSTREAALPGSGSSTRRPSATLSAK